MDCETLIGYLSNYIDNELDDNLTAQAEEHLRTCQNCRVVLDSTQQMLILYRQQGNVQIPAQRRSHLFSQIETAFRNKGVPKSSDGEIGL